MEMILICPLGTGTLLQVLLAGGISIPHLVGAAGGAMILSSTAGMIFF